jgi:hypothetical protein
MEINKYEVLAPKEQRRLVVENASGISVSGKGWSMSISYSQRSGSETGIPDGAGVVCNSNWLMSNSDWSVCDSDLLDMSDLWGRSVDDGVESVDVISGICDGSDRSVSFNKGVLSK